MSEPGVVAEPALEDFRSSAQAEPGAELVGLDSIAELQVTLSMEVGRATITVRELLQFTAGSVIGLDRSTDEPFDVLINGRVLARGEPVMVDQRCGVRLVSVVQPCERRDFPGR